MRAILALLALLSSPAWAQSYANWPSSGSGGSVTSITAGTGLSGGTITTTGTISLTAPVTIALGGTNNTSAYTLGSIPYFDGTKLTQDNANLFWDSTNKRLGIGNATPGVPLDVKSTGGYSYGAEINNNDYWMSINKGTGNEQDFSALGGVRWGWSPGGAETFQMNDTGSGNATQLIARHSRDFQIIPDGTTTTNNVKIGASASQTTPILELQDTVPNTVFQINVNGHLKTKQVAATTAVVNANAGTGASCSVSHATDVAGLVALTTTGVASSSGTVCAVTFASVYAVAPICLVTPTSSNAIVDAVIQGVYFTTSTSVLNVVFTNTDAIGRTYNWSYHCIETQ